MPNKQLISFLLRTGLAIVFLYAAIHSLIEPNSWIGFLPNFLKEIMPAGTLLILFSIYEIALALWLLSGARTYYAALLSSLTLAAIVFTNITVFEIVFRDLAILFAGAALAVLSKEK